MKKVKSIIYSFVLTSLLWIGILLSAWAILSIEIEWIPKVPTCFSVATVTGINKVFLALAYSYIAGAVIYWFTVKFPFLNRFLKIKPVIDAKIEGIGIQLSKMNVEFRDKNNPVITDVEAVMSMFSAYKWKGKCRMPEHILCRNVTEAFIRDYEELREMVGSIINDYNEYLSQEQIQLLECLRCNPLNGYFAPAKGSDFQYEYTDGFIEKALQPEYRKLLEVYNNLINIDN